MNLCLKLAFYVVDAFVYDEMVIRTSRGDILCDRQAVRDVFGIPIDATAPIKCGPSRKKSDFYVDWCAQFSNSEAIRASDIASVIVHSKGVVDRFFRMNFLMLFYNTMICSDSNGLVLFHVLEYVDGDCQNVSKMDWCGELLYKLQYSKNAWNRNFPKKRPYCGPLTFLTLLYLDRTKFDEVRIPRQRPIFKSWLLPDIKFRSSKEMALGAFGLLELAPVFLDSNEDKNAEKEEISQEKKDYLSIIDEKLKAISSMKGYLFDIFQELSVKYGPDEVFADSRRQMISIFGLKVDLIGKFDVSHRQDDDVDVLLENYNDAANLERHVRDDDVGIDCGKDVNDDDNVVSVIEKETDVADGGDKDDNDHLVSQAEVDGGGGDNKGEDDNDDVVVDFVRDVNNDECLTEKEVNFVADVGEEGKDDVVNDFEVGCGNDKVDDAEVACENEAEKGGDVKNDDRELDSGRDGNAEVVSPVLNGTN